MGITLRETCHLREKDEGRCGAGDRRTWFPMLTGSGLETVCRHGRWLSAMFSKCEWRSQSNGMSRWSGRGEYLGAEPGAKTGHPYMSSRMR